MKREKLREQIKLIRRRQSRELVVEKSEKIQAKLFSLREFMDARKITFYVAKKSDGEVETEQMIRDSLRTGKKVLIPITDKPRRRLVFSELRDYDAELTLGTFGIKEPKREYRRIVPPNQTDLVTVPGIVFDLRGYRLGYGFGYYDRFLSSLSVETPTIGLAFEFQIENKVQTENHDIPVHRIITEKRVIDCR